MINPALKSLSRAAAALLLSTALAMSPALAKNGNGGGGGNGGGHGGGAGNHGGGSQAGAKAGKSQSSKTKTEKKSKTTRTATAKVKPDKIKTAAEEPEETDEPVTGTADEELTTDIAASALGKLNGFMHASPNALAKAAPNSAIGKVAKVYAGLLNSYLSPGEGETPPTIDEVAAALADAANKPLTADVINAVNQRLLETDPTLAANLETAGKDPETLADEIVTALTAGTAPAEEPTADDDPDTDDEGETAGGTGTEAEGETTIIGGL